MAQQSLAVKYRPKDFDDVTEQGAIKVILQQQIKSGNIRNAYLFCGGAGTGKTTCARILADRLNDGAGNPIELDAASHNSVDDIRDIAQRAKTAALDGEYKVFILDEVHALSGSAWQAMLKILEEPPKRTVFIMCTTDPQKIPKTILSRVQRYDFQRISKDGIYSRLVSILNKEYPSEIGQNDIGIPVEREALDYIAKIADGGMRDAITMLDKCLAYRPELTISNVLTVLGTASYPTMFRLARTLLCGDSAEMIDIVEEIHYSGKDLKQFIKTFMQFALDLNKYECTGKMGATDLPSTCELDIQDLRGVVGKSYSEGILDLLNALVKLNAEIKWETAPKSVIEASFVLFCADSRKEG